MFWKDAHPSLTLPPDDSVLWRYMDLARYLALLQQSALHFVRADQMRDKWEGAYSRANAALWDKYRERDNSPWIDHLSEHRGRLQRMHMNCWHESRSESAAMWEIYQREGRGVAIRTTWASLTGSLTGERPVLGGRVKYIDYTSEYIPVGNVLEPFMHKRLSYRHEQEVRLLVMSGKSGPTRTEHGVTFSNYLGPEDPVIPVAVDLSTMVEEVYVAPDAPGWVADVVAGVSERYGFKFRISHSDLASDPVA